MHQTGAEQACQALLSGRKPEQRCSCQTGWLRTTESPRDSRSPHNEKGPVLRDIVTTLTMHPRTEHQTVRGKQRSGCGAERGRALTARGFGAARSNAQVRGAEKQRGHRRARRRRPPPGVNGSDRLLRAGGRMNTHSPARVQRSQDRPHSGQ